MSRQLRRAFTVLLCFILFAALGPLAFAEDAAPVTVIFSLDDESALPGLHVTDSAGNVLSPMTDAATDTVQYGQYLLLPGDYLCSFHDEGGRYEDFERAVTIEQAIRYIIPLDLTPIIEIQRFSFTYVDPAYADVLTEADIPPVTAAQDEAAEAELRELATVLTNNAKRNRAIYFWDKNIYFDNVKDAADDLRAQIKAFESSATVRFTADSSWTEQELGDYFMQIWYATIAHNGVPDEGDYLRYEHGGYKINFFKFPESDDGNGICYNIVQMTLFQYTNAAQEKEVGELADSILASLDLEGKTDYQKVRSIYDYLCANVSYGGTGDIKRTAYSALINHLAYCQGYAAAFYRLCLSAGIDTRMITSSGMQHAWNIVKLNGQYYELDSTWDANHTPATYLYFLKGEKDWLSGRHTTKGDQFSTTSFANAYPVPADSVPIVSFAADNGSTILPQYVLAGDQASRPETPVKDGYWFVDWYADSGFKTRYDFQDAVTADMTLYARWAAPDLLLPAALSEIGEEAFSGGAFSFPLLPEGAESIGPRAFADCPELICVYIPEKTDSIDSTAFANADDLTIFGVSPSAAETFAAKYGYSFSAVNE